MAQPTAAVTDNFNRTNQSPIGSPWVNGATGLRIVSNQLATISGEGEARYNVPVRGDYYNEVGITMATQSGGGFDIAFFNSDNSGYMLEAGSGNVALYRVDEDEGVQLGASFSAAPASGDTWALTSHPDGTIEAWRRRSGTWALQATRTDTTYHDSGDYRPYVSLWNSTARADDFFVASTADPSSGVEVDIPRGGALADGVPFTGARVALPTGGALAGGNPVTANMPPTVSTTDATAIGSRGGTFHGTINPNGLSTTYQWQWGLSPGNYGWGSTSAVSAGSGSADVPITSFIGGEIDRGPDGTFFLLSAATTYYYRLAATNASGVTYSSGRSFTTASGTWTPTANAATDITSSSATLNGSITAYADEYNTASFEIVYTTDGSTPTISGTGTEVTPTPGSSNVSGSTDVTYALTGLSPGATVKYIVAVHGVDPTDGSLDWVGSSVQTFSTLAPAGSFIRTLGEVSEAGENVTELSVTLDQDVPTGRTLIIRAVCEPLAGPSTFIASDDRGNTYTQDKYAVMSGNYPQTAILRAPVTTALEAGDAVTVTFPGETFGSFVVDEFAGILVPDGSGSATGNSTTPAVTVTPGHTGDVVIGAVFVWTGSSITFTQDSDTLDGSWGSIPSYQPGLTALHGAFKIVTGTSTQVYNPSLATMRYWSALGVAYQASILPTATVTGVSAITPTSATLSATADPGSLSSVSAQFQVSTGGGWSNAGSPTTLVSGSQSISASATGLSAATTYSVRVALTNTGGTWYSETGSFTTPATTLLSPGGAVAGGNSFGAVVQLPTGGAVADGRSVGAAVPLERAGALAGGNGFGTLTPPTAATLAANAITIDGATLHATINPNGSSTTWYFQWGVIDGATNSSTPVSAGSGTSPVDVELDISDLDPLTDYLFLVYAVSDLGMTAGGVQSFTTLPLAPVVTIGAASDIGGWFATLNGTVDPQGAATTYQYEYGPTTGYGSVAPFPAGNAGTGSSAVPVSVDIDELDDLAVYHFRLSATNAGGTTHSSDATFTTLALPPVVETSGAVGITTNQANLSGLVTWSGDGSQWFEWGTTALYGNTTAVNVDNDPYRLGVAKIITGLQPNTFYHFRTVAQNDGGITYGPDKVFRTLPFLASIGALDANVLSYESAQLQALVSSQGAGSFYFEWGLDDDYGNVTPVTQMVAGYQQLVSARIEGLTAETEYHFRAVVTNAAGTVYGADSIFETFVFPSPFGEALYQSMSPQARLDDVEQGYALRTYCYAIGQMFDPVEHLARESDSGPGWSSIFDLQRAPDNALPYLGQFVGTPIPQGMAPDEARALIDAPSGLRRGTLGAIRSAAEATLTGTKYILVNERDTSAYHMTVYTRSSETPDPTATLNAMLAVKPAGIVLVHVVTDSVTWAEATNQWSEATTTWEDADIDDIT